MDRGGGEARILHLACAPSDDATHPRRVDGTLAALGGTPAAGHFCAWRGASDRRYVCSVFPAALSATESVVGGASGDLGLPEFDGFVLALVRHRDAARQIVDIIPIERSVDRAMARRRGTMLGVDEWHVYLQAGDRVGRSAVAGDLRERHCASGCERQCA